MPKYAPTLIDGFCLKIDALLPNCALTHAPTLIDGFCLKIDALLPNCALTTIKASHL